MCQTPVSPHEHARNPASIPDDQGSLLLVARRQLHPAPNNVLCTCQKVCLLVVCMHPTHYTTNYQYIARLQASSILQQTTTNPQALRTMVYPAKLVANERQSVEDYQQLSAAAGALLQLPTHRRAQGAPASHAAAHQSRPCWTCGPPWTRPRPPQPAWRRPAWRRPASRAPHRGPGRSRQAPGWH